MTEEPTHSDDPQIQAVPGEQPAQGEATGQSPDPSVPDPPESTSKGVVEHESDLDTPDREDTAPGAPPDEEPEPRDIDSAGELDDGDAQ